MRFIYLVLTNILLISTCLGQAAKMDFVEYEPVSTLMVPEHKLTRSKFPFIDVHNHQNGMPTQDLGTLIQEMDKLNMKVMVNLSGQSGNQIISSVKNVKEHYPSRRNRCCKGHKKQDFFAPDRLYDLYAGTKPGR